ncbi:hypothetical protein SERLA73DRAFT_181475, partial [Serpula lacrymans var. lacrymans S7.3]
MLHLNPRSRRVQNEAPSHIHPVLVRSISMLWTGAISRLTGAGWGRRRSHQARVLRASISSIQKFRSSAWVGGYLITFWPSRLTRTHCVISSGYIR